MEDLGADLVEFSPLCDDTLPAGVDLVILGCGYPDNHADALAANLSLISSLQVHVCRGRRIYAESGGAAYLGRNMILDGRRVPGAGILPFDAVVRRGPCTPTPVARRLVRRLVLGPRGTLVRGYHSGRWDYVPAPDPMDCPGQAGPLTTALDMFARHHAVGGILHLHLASLPEVVAAFAEPHPPSLTLPRRP